jgi:hypothetical protein
VKPGCKPTDLKTQPTPSVLILLILLILLVLLLVHSAERAQQENWVRPLIAKDHAR